MCLVGPFDTPKQARDVIKTLDPNQMHQIRHKNSILPLKLVCADNKVISDIQNICDPTIVGVVSNMFDEHTSYLLHISKWE